ncbi:MAG: FAD-dependent oxidoreductase [Helicobacteraceae bacterium]|jgi:succinate dehydrogenase/fumarate reductase flavoprotein subunit|nr:FAD-dependent oxidoreductase [Helicobacteraceae bacterium]
MLYDVIVVGSGISGLYSALYAKKAGFNVAVLTQSNPFRSNSAVASGGINAVINIAELDSVARHVSDTVEGADGLSHLQNIEKMFEEAPNIVKELSEMGVGFDEDAEGNLEQRPFGGASANRTCYIADRTGASIVQTLLVKCRDEGVHILSNHKFLNITQYNGKLSGVTVLRRHNTQVIALACKSLVLAGGGYAGIYRGHSTNSQESSGDVIAAALRAHMRLSNMEFVQFHPTTLASTGALISEAARGEGAILVDETQERFTDELQTRDKLSRAITTHMLKGHKVYLDFRHLDEKVIETKLPSAQKMALNAAGVDIRTELLEITPSAHYSIGGIWTREDTSTDMPFVFACGECAVTGVHGANRLGGNSLLEGAYFGRLAGREAARAALKRDFQPVDYADVNKEMRRVELIVEGESHFNINAMRKNLGESLFRNAGVFRSESTLADALEYIHYLMKRSYGLHCVNKERHNNVELPAILEFQNALTIAEAMVVTAMQRKESRGVHYREDYPMRDDRHFDSASYVLQLQYNYMRVSFENAVQNNLWYNIKKALGL